MAADIRAVVDAEWESRLGIDRSLLHDGGVHVVAADLGANDAMSYLLDGTCIVVVAAADVERARVALRGLDAMRAFTADALRRVVGGDAQVHGPSWHHYCDRQCFVGAADGAAHPVDGDDPSLLRFLESNELDDWAESGFPRDPSSADPATNRFWIVRDEEEVVAAGNLTEWRAQPADVGLLTHPQWRGRGYAARLAGAMVHDALASVDVVRYRALASNVASLSVARRLGFQLYGQNFRGRRARP